MGHQQQSRKTKPGFDALLPAHLCQRKGSGRLPGTPGSQSIYTTAARLARQSNRAGLLGAAAGIKNFAEEMVREDKNRNGKKYMG